MKKNLLIAMAAAAVLAGCSTTGRTAQTAADLTQPRSREVRRAKAQPVKLDLTALFESDRAGRKVTLNRGELQLTTDEQGRITFDMPDTDTLILSADPCPELLARCSFVIPLITGLCRTSFAVMLMAAWAARAVVGVR
jgi:hypothetical protein